MRVANTTHVSYLIAWASAYMDDHGGAIPLWAIGHDQIDDVIETIVATTRHLAKLTSNDRRVKYD